MPVHKQVSVGRYRYCCVCMLNRLKQTGNAAAFISSPVQSNPEATELLTHNAPALGVMRARVANDRLDVRRTRSQGSDGASGDLFSLVASVLNGSFVLVLIQGRLFLFLFVGARVLSVFLC
jgi:hypothetical protein